MRKNKPHCYNKIQFCSFSAQTVLNYFSFQAACSEVGENVKCFRELEQRQRLDGNLCLAAAASADSGSDISLALCLPDGNISSLISFFSVSHKEENWTASPLIMVCRANTRRVKWY